MWNMLALAAPQGGGSAGLALLIQFVAIILIFWFLLIRPQRQAQKRHQEMIAALKKGDHVMTDGGIIGEVVHLKEDRITIKTAENTRIVVARPKIARVFTEPQAS
ncbi:MAG TPA: preprotein translocase subunit YajC [Longimicrobiales bacterium]|nr:preprotein translocase subunit YajC [Longimicrobiales bacterium]